jgi:hypothetical protein
MSRSRNKHDKSWNYPKREAKHWSKKNRRNYGARLENRLRNGEDIDDLAYDLPRNAGNGDIWLYD